jgi:EAL domain-containing protein (putative c-di-GMP-specific phosphodiesterase class I)
MNVMLDILTRMRLKGFGLSIDDFGTGFSSLALLRKIPFTELKIDRSFVHMASDNQASRAILESSIALSKKLGIQCVAEGVEDAADWNLIKSLGCDIAQGYYRARPMPPEDFLRWAREHSLTLLP